MAVQNRRLLIIVCVVAALLSVPLIAMQFTQEVTWTLSDFMVAGGLLLGTGLLCELVLRKVKKPRHRLALCLVVLVAFLLIWLELAVGIFGSLFAGS